MKNKVSFRILSMALCFALFLTIFTPATGTVTQAAALTPTGIQKVTFDEENLSEILEDVQLGDVAPTAPSAVVDREGDKVFVPTVSTNKYSNITTVKDSQLADALIESFSFQVEFENAEHGGESGTFYTLYDVATNSAAGFKFYYWGESKQMVYFRNVAYGTGISTDLKPISGQNLYGSNTFDATETLTVTAHYDYSLASEGKVQIWYEISSDTQSVRIPKSGMATYAVSGLSDTLPIKTLKPALSNSLKANTIYYDDLKFTYNNSEIGMAHLWYQTYAELLAKTSATYNPAVDGTVWQSALDSYIAMDKATKTILIEQGLLDKLLEMAGKSATPEATAYAQAHATALALTTDTALPAHSAIVEAAIEAYKKLDQISQVILDTEYFELLEVQQYLLSYVAPRADEYDTTPMLFNFNYDMNYFTSVGAADDLVIDEIVPDPLNPDSGNHVWHMENYNSGHYILPDAYWASATKPTVITLKMYMEENPSSFARPGIYLSFFDEDNWSGITFSENAAWKRKVVDGVASDTRIWYDTVSGFDMTSGWCTITIRYATDTATVTVVDANDHSASGTVNFIPGGTFGFRFLGSSNGVLRGESLYIDDVNIALEIGDFDVNEPVGKISVYYTGNSFLKPNDTLFLSGEKLGTTVKDVYIMRLDNATNPALGYIAAFNWSSSGQQYYDANYAKNPAAQWNENKAVKVDILQRSDLSLNTVIPADIGEGIYLLKLTAAVEGYDDAYVYVNVPELTQIQGNHGSIVTPGGTLSIIGHNLNPDYAEGKLENVAVTLKNLTTGALTNVTEVTGFKDNAALEITVPEDLTKGNYVVYVHSGYGDRTCWSVPMSITVGDDPREAWPDIVYNVKDFGATGDGNTNDTPAFMLALQAAHESGGGIVYVPQGSYHVISTLVIPENVHLKGEDNGNTMIWWSARRWAIGQMPAAHMRILGNCEISDIYFYGTRFNSFITKEENGIGNVYIHDIRVFFANYAGASTGGGSTATTGKYQYYELAAMLTEEQNENCILFRISDKYANNVQLETITMDMNGHTTRPIGLTANYWSVRNVDGMLNWATFGGNYGILVDSTFRGSVGLNCNAVYFARNEVQGTGNNNKELMTTDGAPYIKNVPMEYVGDDPQEMAAAGWGLDSADNKVTYKLSSGSNEGFLYHTVSVTGGQGLGQTRRIVKQNGRYIQVETPFAVQPNRNGTITLQRQRLNFQLVNNNWSSGDAVGTYGAMLGAVYDSNTFTDFGMQVFNSHYGPMWYLSNINSHYTDPVYVHGDGAGIGTHEDDIYSISLILHGDCPFANMGIVFRDNVFDGYWFSLSNGNYNNAMEGLVIEDNVFKNIGNNKFAIDFTIPNTSINNILIRDNDFQVDRIYDDNVESNINITKHSKFDSYKVMDDYSIPSKRRGDANMDGKVTMADNLAIRQYLAGLTEFTAEQLEYADVNKDGIVDLKDATQIRRYVEQGTPFTNASGDIEADF